MSKRPSLAEGMRAVATEPAALIAPLLLPAREPATVPKPVAASLGERPTGYYAATRTGKKKATATLSSEAHRQLKSLAVEQGGTVEGLLIEAITDLFQKHGKSVIA